MYTMRAFVTGPGKGKRPAALRFGSAKPLAANADGTFTLTPRNLLALLNNGYHVESTSAQPRKPVVLRSKPYTTARASSVPTIPIALYYRNQRR
jgi:hypothetical protein